MNPNGDVITGFNPAAPGGKTFPDGSGAEKLPENRPNADDSCDSIGAFRPPPTRAGRLVFFAFRRASVA